MNGFQGPLDLFPLWLLFAATVALICGAVEAGYRLGRYRRIHFPEKEAPVGAMAAAMLGLLAFMLAFTFGLAATRFDERRHTILNESNAIGTTYLRAEMLPLPHRPRVRKLLRDYVDARVEGVAMGQLNEAVSQSQELQRQLWTEATAVAEADPYSIVNGLFVQSLNEMIDLHSTRLMVGLRSRIPAVIWGALYFVATLTMATMGYHEGLTGARRSLASFALVVAFSSILFMTVDLDRPQEGLLRISQQSLLDLQQLMQADEKSSAQSQTTSPQRRREMNSSPDFGQSAPLGATLRDGGVNFSLFSRHASGVTLLLFDAVDGLPVQCLQLDPANNRTYHYWHLFVPNLRPGQIYAYRVDGTHEPELGLRFDPDKTLLDPYGREVVVPAAYGRAAATLPGDNAATAMKNVVVDPEAYDWEGDRPLRHMAARTIVYEMHVRGFTRHPNSGLDERLRGTYAGLVAKIPYLQSLGITAVELLPVYQFDEQDGPYGKTNYWGYSPIGFFAPHQAYSSRREPLGPTTEFRDMVKALHRAGIEVILDVVFNHTAEGNHLGPMLSFRGVDNPSYYILGDRGATYAKYTGCGNTLNANHPIVRRMIVDSLRYWVEEMHVDGFRFDLASILTRDAAGRPLPNPPVLWDIESEPTLAGTKLLAEAWDAAGLYQVGQFVGDSWREWNGRFRDDVRDFLRGVPGALRRAADRIVGSPEIFGLERREAEQSVNFVTCHDGFTLNDLVSYNGKHNEANGEQNRDGADDNRSWNCGVEGPTDDPAIEALRERQIKNFLTITFLSFGMPMIVMGDEVRRTQQGNNNAYCQDNEISWFDWSLVAKHASLLRFVRLLIERRLLRGIEHELKRMSVIDLLTQARKAWHGVKLNQPDWGDGSHAVALNADLRQEGISFHMILNAYWEPLDFELPPPPAGRRWLRWIDTSLRSPEDIVPWQEAKPVAAQAYHTEPRSVVMLFAEDAVVS